MTFSLSPAVTVKETDLTTTVPVVATTNGGIVGMYEWGPVNERRLVTSPDNYELTFGKANNTNFNDWFQGFNFLAYANSLYVVRVVSASAINASDVQELTTQVFNGTDFETKKATLDATTNSVVAKYPGARGDKISLSYSGPADFATWAYKDLFEYTPLAANAEIAVVILDDGEVVEQFMTSTTVGSKNYQGQTNYLIDMINRNSEYVWLLDKFITVDAQLAPTLTTGTVALDFGADGTVPTAGNYQIGIDLFADSETLDLDFAIATSDDTVGKYWLDNVCSVRRDCIGVVGVQLDTVVGLNAATATTNVIAERQKYGSTSYGFFVDNYKYQYDKYNDVWRWVALNGDVAGLMAQAIVQNDSWTSPAGYNNGVIKNLDRLAYNPLKVNRDELYKNQVNPVTISGGSGAVLLGDKTMLEQPSAFAYYNVRRLFIVLEKAIATASKFQLFDYNDEFTRTNFKNMVVPYLRTVQGQRGILDFRVVCDERNNTADIIDQGQFIADIYIKPNRTIQGMNLNFIATRTGVNFDEIIDQSSPT